MDIKVLYKVSYGMYIVCSKSKDRFNGQIANTVVQVTADPPKLSVCINKKNLTHQYIRESNIFAVSILEKDATIQLIGNFGFKSGREFDKFKGIEYKLGKTGVPVIVSNCLGYIECELENSVDAGTHTIFIGKIVGTQMLKDGEPLTYAYYHQVKKGKTQKNAPTYIKNESKKIKEGNMEKYKCSVCEYIYDPKKGDPDSGIEPGTSFEDLPEDWVCPVCGAGKDSFEKED